MEKFGGFHCWGIGMDVLRCRVAITCEVEAWGKTGETVIQKISNELPVP
jgi:hypothetical protein